MDRIIRARIPVGPYRVAIGDVLQLTMPLTLFPDIPQVTPERAGEVTRRCRVTDDGLITLPDGREISVAGNSLAEIENAVVDVYYPEFVKARPLVYAEVVTYNTQPVQILGGVVRPGRYHLRHDQMYLVTLLMEAGGILEQGASVIRIAPGGNPVEKAPASTPSGRTSFGDMKRKYQGERIDTVGHQVVPTATFPGMPWEARLWFRAEGPLRTTGWIVLERNGEVLLRRWLDVGNVPQKRQMLETAATRLDGATIALADQKLVRLAWLLESGPNLPSVHFAANPPQADWQRTGAGNYVVPLGEMQGSQQGRRKVAPAAEDLADPSELRMRDGRATVLLPVRGLNIPFADVPLREGDTVLVERVEQKYVTVLGLVQRPGNFDYPTDVHYNLAQAIGLAGGLNLVADPRYVSIYRPRGDGTVASATFQLVDSKNQEALTKQLALSVRPGDVVSVEHTPRTRTNLFIERVLHISLGLYLRPEEMWE